MSHTLKPPELSIDFVKVKVGIDLVAFYLFICLFFGTAGQVSKVIQVNKCTMFPSLEI